MYVEKPVVKKDSYEPDAKLKNIKLLTKGGFRFMSTQRERVNVSFLQS